MKKKSTSPKQKRAAKKKAGGGCPEASCSPCDSAFARFHEERRQALLDHIEKCVARHVKNGGNDSPPYRTDCAYDGMRDLPGHSDRDIWNAAWEACLAQDPNHGKIPWDAKIPSSWWKLSSDKFWEKVTNSLDNATCSPTRP